MRTKVLLSGILSFSVLLSQANASTHVDLSSLSLPFIKNEGQVSKDIMFYADTLYGKASVLKDSSLLYVLMSKNGQKMFKEKFELNAIPVVKPLKSSNAIVNYFKGKKRFTNLKTFKSIEIKNIQKGIDVELRAYAKKVEKIFKIKPNYSPSSIKVSLEGIENIKVNKKGELEIVLGKEIAKFTKPIAYQFINGKKKFVKVSYKKLNNHSYSFTVGKYDKSKPLYIDPLLSSTYLGGYGDDIITAITKDQNGDIFVAGKTTSDNFPVKGGYDTDYNDIADFDVFVAKFDSSLENLKSATYIGGSSKDEGSAIKVNSDGDVIVAGTTESLLDFPTTSDIDGTTIHRYATGFVIKLDNMLSALKASSLFGGNDYDFVYDLSLDGSNNIYIVGSTYSSNFPVSATAYQKTYSGNGIDGFVMKVDSNISSIVASTYLCGTNEDEVYGLDLDSNGDVFVVGRTKSCDFPSTSGVYQNKHSEKEDDVFISKLDSNLEHLKASTFLGTSGDDIGRDIKLNGNYVYIDGYTSSRDFPTTKNAYDKTYNGGYYDVFVSKLDKNLKYLIASTFVGGYGDDRAYNLGINTKGEVYVVGGFSQSRQFPITTGAFQEESEDYSDSFISKFSSDLDKLLASTYLGGNGEDKIWSILVDGNNLYVAGGTGSNNFPITSNAYSVIYNDGDYDGFISKFDEYLTAIGSNPRVINFGKVVEDSGEVKKSITLFNSGKSKQNITKIKVVGADSDEFEIKNDNCTGITLNPQESCTFDIVFDPKDAGNKNDKIVVYVDGKAVYEIAVESITLKKKDDGDDGLDFGDDGVDFGYVQDSACSMSPVSSGALPLYLLIPFLIGVKRAVKRLFRK